MGLPIETLHRLNTPDGIVLAWGCPCGEEAEGEMAVIRWDEPGEEGIYHSFCHVGCLKKRSK